MKTRVVCLGLWCAVLLVPPLCRAAEDALSLGDFPTFINGNTLVPCTAKPGDICLPLVLMEYGEGDPPRVKNKEAVMKAYARAEAYTDEEALLRGYVLLGTVPLNDGGSKAKFYAQKRGNGVRVVVVYFRASLKTTNGTIGYSLYTFDPLILYDGFPLWFKHRGIERFKVETGRAQVVVTTPVKYEDFFVDGALHRFLPRMYGWKETGVGRRVLKFMKDNTRVVVNSAAVYDRARQAWTETLRYEFPAD